ncbi:MAG: DUF805 domain-containing protein [Brevundimonas sp.]|nr:MAG: DUF805 domain-containing protein [Brevundimonas sp.]
MRGEVLTYDDGPGAGLISGDDGARYTFSRADLQQLTPVRAGTKVDFVAVDGVATQIVITVQQGGYAQTAYGSPGGYTPGVAGSGGGGFDWKTLFLQPGGRIGQKDYWIGFGILFAANIVLSLIPVIGLLASIVAIYAGVCVASKRLHDFGKSGWLAAIPYGVWIAAIVLSMGSFIGGIINTASYDNDFGVLAGMGGMFGLWTLAFFVNVAFVIWLGVTAGDQGDNAYGPPPASIANF